MISIKPTLLVLVYLAPEHRNLLSDRFELLYAPNEGLGVDRSNGQEQINLRGEEIEFVLQTEQMACYQLKLMPCQNSN